MDDIQTLEQFVRQGWGIRVGRRYLVSLDCDVTETPENGLCVWISRIFTPRQIRRQGYARQALERLCQGADEQNIKLCLMINPYGEMSFEQLQTFYESFGFEMNEEQMMLRMPQVECIT